MPYLATFDENSRIIRVKLMSSSTGGALTGLTSASSGLKIATIASSEAASTVYTSAGSTIETIATLGTYATPTATKCRFAEVDATNHPGLYEIQLNDARLSVVGAKYLVVTVSGATNLVQVDLLINTTVFDLQSATPTVTASTVSDKTGYSLSQTFPTNFSSLAITAGGAITAGTVGDKTGYALTVTPPTAAQIDTQLSGTHGSGLWAATGSGAITWTYTVTDTITGFPIDGVEVRVSTDISGVNTIARGVTDASGITTFYLDAGTYYVWCSHSSYSFNNPDTEVVT